MGSARVGIAAFSQESNSFAPVFAEVQDFEQRAGQDLVTAYSGTNTEVGGFLDGCQEQGWTAVPIFSAWATSGGPVSNGCLEEISRRLCAMAQLAGVDGMLLCLHGAMCSESHDSADAEVARCLRVALGGRVPVVATHDFHAHVEPALLEQIDGLIGYRTYPHIDMRETGRRAASLLAKIFAGARPRHWYLPLPMLTPSHASSTFEPPLLPVMNELDSAFRDEAGAYGSLFVVQPWLDVPTVGNSVVVSECGEDPKTRAKVLRLARLLWEARGKFVSCWTEPVELVSRVKAQTSRPVLISEGYDAPSGGAAGDHTGLLSLLLPHAREIRCCLYLVDPQVASQARAAGTGARIETELGAKLDPRWSKPVAISALVRNLSDGEFTYKGRSYTGKRLSMGPTAVLENGGMLIVVGTRAVFMHDPELYRSQNVEPLEMDAVAVKSPTAFRVCYEDVSRTVLYVDLPGVCSGRLESLPFRRVDRPIYPRDDVAWEPSIDDIRSIRPRTGRP